MYTTKKSQVCGLHDLYTEASLPLPQKTCPFPMRCLLLLFIGHVQELPKILRVVSIVPELFDEGN